jgi:hypothetical protein
MRDSGQLSMRLDTEGGYRGVLDLNSRSSAVTAMRCKAAPLGNT